MHGYCTGGNKYSNHVHGYYTGGNKYSNHVLGYRTGGNKYSNHGSCPFWKPAGSMSQCMKLSGQVTPRKLCGTWTCPPATYWSVLAEMAPSLNSCRWGAHMCKQNRHACAHKVHACRHKMHSTHTQARVHTQRHTHTHTHTHRVLYTHKQIHADARTHSAWFCQPAAHRSVSAR
jgi:hypothetical protein